MPGLLVIMGSGETAPTMVKPHRAIFERVGDAPAILLDTPYGFQENADDISTRAVGYFAASVGRTISALSWRTAPPPGLARDRALKALDEAGWIFAGPGSPTYALRQWRDTPVPEAFGRTLDRGGVVVFASAAALTLGSHTVPVYEIYKAGFEPEWVPGLDLVRRATGLPAVVIPHYDNAEGGHHDTRFCYLGERRLSTMERELPPEALILGVDEHTGVLFDLDARTATVVGRGGFTIRRGGRNIVHPSGSVVSFDEIAGFSGTAAPVTPAPPSIVDSDNKGSLRAEADRLDEAFTAAYAARDVDGCVAALLDLEQVLVDWSADTLTSDEGEHARTVLRRMVLRLGELASAGATDPRTVITPFVEALLDLRATARTARDFATSDRVRDALVTAGVEVRDTPDGVAWDLRS
jgi:cyanophycinase-like exopeptidase